jgi:hypothetical protein
MAKLGDEREKEIPLTYLDDDAPRAAQSLLAFWNAHASKASIPTRTDFRPDNLTPWVDDIAIYEYVPEKDDFQILLEGENIVELTGENWRGAFAREVDCRFSSSLHAAMSEVRSTGWPQIHHLRIFQREWQRGIRLLLPVLLQKPGKEDVIQIFLAIFPVDD